MSASTGLRERGLPLNATHAQAGRFHKRMSKVRLFERTHIGVRGRKTSFSPSCFIVETRETDRLSRASRLLSRTTYSVAPRAESMREDSRAYVSNSIRAVPDFPKKGINFHDVTTLLLDPRAFKLVIDDFTERYREQNIDAVVGFEARGFIFGAPLALALGVPFVPLRKPGKLPGETISAEYELEYGSDKVEMHVDAIKEGQRVLLVDDLIATGGTLAAGIKLMRQVGVSWVEAACVIEMPDLKGREKLSGVELYAQVEKEGD